jgi:hypothetical protein
MYMTSKGQHSSYKHLSQEEQVLHSLILPENTTLKKTYTVSSPFATHITYAQVTDKKEVVNHGVKIHLKANGKHVVQNDLTFLPASATYVNGESWFVNNDELQAVTIIRVDDIRDPYKQWVREDGYVLQEQSIHKFAKKDTTLFAQVFMVNPINSAAKAYGGVFVDANDQTNSSLDSQMVWQSVKAQFDNDTFFLASDFLTFEDISSPADSFFYTFSDSLSYTRDQQAFELVNVYYHINAMGEYVDSLGYAELTQQLRVDVHAFGGWDNSAYTPVEHTLQFGEGGIDDAEDGEVVIHEFTHSLSELASPNNTIGTERMAMEEGACDYLAKAYSRSINDNTPDKVFSWDGNETWNGFQINTNRLYPGGLKNSKDGDRDMWSSALMCAHDYIGRKAMDSLLLEHFYYQGANTTMAQMAQIILDIDSLDFNKRYYSSLKQCYVDAGFVQRGASIKDNEDFGALKILNQLAFAQGTGNLRFQLPQSAKVSVYSAMGQLVSTHYGRAITLDKTTFTPGLYVIRAEIDGKQYNVKIIR